jgi:hypothetical protein
MTLRRLHGAAVMEALFEGGRHTSAGCPEGSNDRSRRGNIVCGGLGHLPVFNLCQAADVQNEFRPTPARRQLIAGPFYLAIGLS